MKPIRISDTDMNADWIKALPGHKDEIAIHKKLSRTLKEKASDKDGVSSGWFGPSEDAKAINVLSDDDLIELYTFARDAGAVEAVKAIEDELIEREKGGPGSGHRDQDVKYDKLPDGPKDLVI